MHYFNIVSAIIKEESLLNPDKENETSIRKLGFIINPVAGMGGAVGLKGTDGKKTIEKAKSLGAKPIAPERAGVFLKEIESIKRQMRLFVGAGEMGENEAKRHALTFEVIGKKKSKTTAKDTIEISSKIVARNADLLVFCGGDGTARNVYEAVGTKIPVLGVPTGVKMHSSVFAVDPSAAAKIAIRFLWGELSLREAEVMDVDEIAFRLGQVSSKLYGFLLTPYEPDLVQGAKISSSLSENELRNQAAIAIHLIETMEKDVDYIIGPGTTTRTIGDLLDEKKTLLGVDIFLNKKIAASDVNEKQILQKIHEKDAKIVVTPIGGQGFVFGRGNQQISPEVIRKVGLNNIIVIATTNKMRSLKRLRVDTGDPGLDDELRANGLRVIIDYQAEYRAGVE